MQSWFDAASVDGPLHDIALGWLVSRVGRAAVRRSLAATGSTAALLGQLQARPETLQRFADELASLGVSALGVTASRNAERGLPGRAPWSPALAAIPDPPLVLFSVGQVQVLTQPVVAVVGARQATRTGLALAHEIGRELAAHGILVCSGLARGIDAAAHRGALEAGATLGVLGGGMSRIYPAEHRGLARSVCAKGLLVSEYAPYVEPRPHHFPERNRLISGFSAAVVVIEAGEQSGSLITARLALEQGRDVMAVPGSVRSPVSRGCHRLLREGAALVESARDILDALQLPGIIRPPPDGRPEASMPAHPAGALGGDALLAELDHEPLPLDLLAHRTGIPAHDLTVRLARLELSGHVAQGAGGYVRLC